jgi:hypothetical protein
MWLMLAIDWDSMLRFDRILAVVVSAFAGMVGILLGMMLTGLLLAVVWPMLSSKRLSKATVWITRLVGGIACGILIFFYVMTFFGGPGSGGPGGWGFGSGEGEGEKGKQGVTDAAVSKDDDGKGKTVKELPSVLYVKVLTDEEIKEAIGERGVKDRKYYRVERPESTGLLTLGELTEKIESADPAVTELHLVLGPDSPAPGTGRVDDLSNWATRHKITVIQDAPRNR